MSKYVFISLYFHSTNSLSTIEFIHLPRLSRFHKSTWMILLTPSILSPNLIKSIQITKSHQPKHSLDNRVHTFINFSLFPLFCLFPIEKLSRVKLSNQPSVISSYLGYSKTQRLVPTPRQFPCCSFLQFSWIHRRPVWIFIVDPQKTFWRYLSVRTFNRDSHIGYDVSPSSPISQISTTKLYSYLTISREITCQTFSLLNSANPWPKCLPTQPARSRTSLSSPCNLDSDSNVTEESDLHK
jgi:hypothetical protein